jgi:threonine dehydrogenase-like Zn-dependent dehydrogenase
VLGHENMGVVEEVGSGVDRISAGGPGIGAVQYRLRHLPQLRRGLGLRVPPGRSA